MKSTLPGKLNLISQAGSPTPSKQGLLFLGIGPYRVMAVYSNAMSQIECDVYDFSEWMVHELIYKFLNYKLIYIINQRWLFARSFVRRSENYTGRFVKTGFREFDNIRRKFAGTALHEP